MLDTTTSLVMIAVVAVATFGTRLFSFLLFPKGKEIPETVRYLGRILPPAIIGMLVVYCLRSTSVAAYPFGLPELIACLAVVGLHLWKRNVLLSVGAGTILYMVLVQYVFRRRCAGPCRKGRKRFHFCQAGLRVAYPSNPNRIAQRMMQETANTIPISSDFSVLLA